MHKSLIVVNMYTVMTLKWLRMCMMICIDTITAQNLLDASNIVAHFYFESSLCYRTATSYILKSRSTVTAKRRAYSLFW